MFPPKILQAALRSGSLSLCPKVGTLMNISEVLDRLNGKLEETPKAKAITIDRAELCDLLLEVELLLKLAIPRDRR